MGLRRAPLTLANLAVTGLMSFGVRRTQRAEVPST